MGELTEAHLEVLRAFDGAVYGSEAVEAIDLDIGLALVRSQLVTIDGPLVGGPLRFVLTDSGRQVLSTHGEKDNG